MKNIILMILSLVFTSSVVSGQQSVTETVTVDKVTVRKSLENVMSKDKSLHVKTKAAMNKAVEVCGGSHDPTADHVLGGNDPAQILRDEANQADQVAKNATDQNMRDNAARDAQIFRKAAEYLGGGVSITTSSTTTTFSGSIDDIGLTDGLPWKSVNDLKNQHSKVLFALLGADETGGSAGRFVIIQGIVALEGGDPPNAVGYARGLVRTIDKVKLTRGNSAHWQTRLGTTEVEIVENAEAHASRHIAAMEAAAQALVASARRKMGTVTQVTSLQTSSSTTSATVAPTVQVQTVTREVQPFYLQVPKKEPARPLPLKDSHLAPNK